MHPLRLRIVLWAAALAACGVESPRAAGDAAGVWSPYRDGRAILASDEQPFASSDPPAARVAQLPVECQLPPEMMADEVFMPPPGQGPCIDQAWLLDPNDPAMWEWRLLPSGVVWQSYWAGVKESRMSGAAFNDRGTGYLDVTLGGRASILRYGTDGPGRPMGWELQIEGAGMPRLNLDENWDLDAADFRFGVPLVYGREKWQTKFSYYHLSSHMGDEFAIRTSTPGNNALDDRINYVRDEFVLAGAYFPHPAWRLYAEMGWAFHEGGGARPWEFQFGVDVAEPGPTGITGTPFVAVNGYIREEQNYSGNVVAQAGWLWRGNSTHILRTGFHYFNGKSNQFEFYDQFEQQIGGGLWYDF